MRDVHSRTKVKEVLTQVVLKTVRMAGLEASIGVESAFLGYTGVSTLGDDAAGVLAELVGEIIVVRNTSVDHDAQIALEILSAAGKDLGKMICAVARKLKFKNGKFFFSVIGGVVNCGDLLRTPLMDEVLSNFTTAEMIVPRFPAHCGAYLMAVRAGGIVVTQDLLNRVEGTLLKVI